MPRKPRGIKPTERIEPEPKVQQRIEGLFVCCPLCCLSRKLEKTGGWAKLRKRLDTTQPVKGLARFGSFDLEHSMLIQIRDCSGSRGHGFPTVGGYTIDELKQRPEFSELLADLRHATELLLIKLQ